MDALIHVSDIAWTRKNINLAEEFKLGQEMNAVVVSVDKENQKFSLGIKQLEEDPWKRIEERLPVGSVIEGEVVRVTDFGAFVEVETGIEGLIHISELSDDRVEKPSDVIAKGDKPKCMIISIDKDAKKIALSVKRAQHADDSKMLSAVREDQGPQTMADKLKDFKVNKD